MALGEAPSDDRDALARRAVQRVRALQHDIGLPASLREVGVEESQLPLLAQKAYEDASHLGNPRPCQPADLAALLRAAF